MNQKSQHANPNKNRPPRHRAREFALQGIYQWLLNQEDTGVIDAHIRNAHGFEKADAEHFDILLHGVIKNVEFLRSSIAPFIDRSIEELSPIEHAVLMIGTWELVHSPEIPYRVVINEAVELAKLYGATDGHKFVNGVLDRIAAETRSTEIQARTTSA